MLDPRTKAFNRKGREGSAKVAKSAGLCLLEVFLECGRLFFAFFGGDRPI
jgi:hypothetical protein